MPKETFLNLPTERQQRIDTILLDVFFNKHLSQVNVSEIVEKMQMSRGAFYKYFEDLEDAHHYIVKKYSAIIHQDILQYAMMDESNFLRGFVTILLGAPT
ncbi:TetR/AcrR family transcriptional regulator [Enterococcus alcedinis]|uniref:TetR/AcrR family transcriptional regulator n=1 Tax=Enterococcus alcedinis TaxID=1274384 RepID=UPI003607FBB0